MKGLRIVGKVFAVLFCIVYFFILTVLMVTASSLNLLSGSYYTDILNDVNLDDIKISEFGDLFEDVPNLGYDASLEDVIVSYFKEGGIDEELARAVVNNKNIRRIVGEFIGEFITYNVGGEKPSISKEDIESIFNEPDVQRIIEQSPEKIEVNVDEIYNDLLELIDEMVEDGGVNNGNNGNTKQNFELGW